MQVLVTGAAGFIGFHVAKRLLELGVDVVGIDNLNSYYDVRLKEARLAQLAPFSGFEFRRIDISDRSAIEDLFESGEFESVIHLAAQAGVRYSLQNPHAYADSNLVGFLNVLEGCRHKGIRHLVYASSSSVYGSNTKVPFSTDDNVDHPISLYAATKKANELMAHTYSHLYGLPTTGLRFFSVYGPWGRPDMAYFSFTRAILRGEPINLYHYGDAQRDFTYIDDVVDGIIRVHDSPPSEPQATGEDIRSESVPCRIYNVGNSNPVPLLHFVETLEKSLGQTTTKNLLPPQPGDLAVTYADIAELSRDFDFEPDTPFDVGIERFVQWYREYYDQNEFNAVSKPQTTIRLNLK